MTLDEYLEADFQRLGFPEQRAYEQNLILVRQAISSSPFMSGCGDILHAIANKYAPKNPSLLFGKVPTVEILLKPYRSVLDKSYRENVVFNNKYPSPPKGGWVDGSNFYIRLNDIARATIVCKYMDGPKFVCEELKSYCDGLGVSADYYPMNTDRGYYSWHFYARLPADVFLGSKVDNVLITFELQVTTQLAEVLTALTHGLYREERILPGGKRDDAWKWTPETAKFRSAYMGHTLHLLEGVILGIKEEVLSAAATEEGDKVVTQ